MSIIGLKRKGVIDCFEMLRGCLNALVGFVIFFIITLMHMHENVTARMCMTRMILKHFIERLPNRFFSVWRRGLAMPTGLHAFDGKVSRKHRGNHFFGLILVVVNVALITIGL